MAGEFEMSECGHTDAARDKARVERTNVDEAIHEGATVDIFTDDKKRMRELEIKKYKGEIVAKLWEELKMTKVNAYLKVI